MQNYIIPGVILAALAFYVIAVYNDLQRLKTEIQASIQEIGNQLKRQASLIPNLQASVKGFMKQEKEIFKMLTDARIAAEDASKSGNANDIENAIAKLNQVMPKINVAVEDNPEIKSDQTVAQFMSELRDTADKLMYARRSVIDLSQNYNVKLVTFPSNLIAKAFGFKEEKGLVTAASGSHLSVSDSEMKDVTVNL
jgi:LemA protein